MKISQTEFSSQGIKFSIEQDGQEIARAFLYLMKNGLHDQPFGLLEDVFVDERFRGHGLGTQLVNQVIESAKQNNCYKLVATSRYARTKVHDLYQRIGFANYGKEFRMDFSQ